VQVPAATRVIVDPSVPDDVHTPEAEKLTGRPEDAVADTVKGASLNCILANEANEIVCANGAGDTVKACCTDGAAAYVPSPAWSACTVQVPAVSRVIVDPSVPVAVHIPDAEPGMEKLTGRPEVAVADTVKGASPSCILANEANEIVCAVGSADAEPENPGEARMRPANSTIAPIGPERRQRPLVRAVSCDALEAPPEVWFPCTTCSDQQPRERRTNTNARSATAGVTEGGTQSK